MLHACAALLICTSCRLEYVKVVAEIGLGEANEPTGPARTVNPPNPRRKPACAAQRRRKYNATYLMLVSSVRS